MENLRMKGMQQIMAVAVQQHIIQKITGDLGALGTSRMMIIIKTKFL